MGRQQLLHENNHNIIAGLHIVADTNVDTQSEGVSEVFWKFWIFFVTSSIDVPAQEDAERTEQHAGVTDREIKYIHEI